MFKHFLIFISIAGALLPVSAQFQKATILEEAEISKQLDIHPVKSNVQNVDGKLILPDDNSVKWNRSMISYEKRHMLPEDIQLKDACIVSALPTPS